MDIKTRIKGLFKEGEIYRSQGLFAEAREKYNKVAELLKEATQVANRDSLLETVFKKIEAVDGRLGKIREAADTPELSSQVQDLIKKLFSFSAGNDKDAAGFEGAMALARFGQFDRAIAEFKELLKKDSLRVDAAKNILRCHMTLSSVDSAVDLYKKWLSSDIFPPEELEKIRVFFQDMLDRKGIAKDLPAAGVSTGKKKPDMPEDDFLDISSIGITLTDGPEKGRLVELDVNFQRGNVISIIVSKAKEELIASLEAGSVLTDVQFYSPVAVFSGSGTVLEKAEITLGPRRGDYRLDIRIQSA